MVIPCLLCPNGSFSDCDQLMTSLTRLVNLPLQCPMPYCSYNELGLDNMIRHLASHAHQDFQDHNNLDNLDQVRDANGIFRKKNYLLIILIKDPYHWCNWTIFWGVPNFLGPSN